ncbi:MAG TPA: hypothetical protein VFC78_15665 [Tepidisphaeraceae bacterium]|nr:hypothetical protein [Tepidisphaeraceae bacterium]
MQTVYRPDLWHEAFVMLGGASAALAGLIIVAVSVRADQLAEVPHLWMRGRNNTMSMISVTIGSLVLLLPQPPFLAGTELVILNLLCAVLLPGSVVFYHLRHRTDVSILVPVIAVLLYIMAAAGGVSIILKSGGGIIWIASAYGLYLFWHHTTHTYC